MMYVRFSSSHTSCKSTTVYGLICVIILVNLSSTGAESSSSHPAVVSHCSAQTLQDSFLQESLASSQDLCNIIPREWPANHQIIPEHSQTTRVAELNETTLEKALDLVHNSNGTYIAVLYYATWCPFSKLVRPVFDVLSTNFPTIHHVAVEESSVRPSVLSQYGVHSFPILFVHNRTARGRYYGPRQLDYLIHFYQNYTGFKASEGQQGRKEDCAFARLVYDAANEVKEGCPYPWAISPEKWLQDEMYLSLAIVFLTLRLVYVVMPALVLRLKQWDNRDLRVPSLRTNYPVPSCADDSLLGDARPASENAEVAKLDGRSVSGLNSLSLPGWPPTGVIAQSSSIAVAESSSSRAGTSGEDHDMGGKQMY